MKLRYIFVSIIAALGLAVGCEKEADHYLDEIKVSTSYVALPAEGGSATITLNAAGPWALDNIHSVKTGEKDANGKDITVMLPTPEWLTVSPTSGGAGENTLTFTVEAASDTRETSLNIICEGKTQIINVIQATEKQELVTMSVAEALEVIKPLGDQEVAGGTFRVKGIVCRINEISTQYGNATFYLSDDGSFSGKGIADGCNWIQVYRGLWMNGASFTKGDEFSVGDEITIEGSLMNYNGTPETKEKTAYVVAVTKSLIQVEDLGFETLPAEAGTFNLTVSAKVSPILVTSNVDWMRVTDVDGESFVVSYDENTRTANRTATLTIKAPGALKTVDVTQVGVPPSGATVTEIIALDDDAEVETLESTTVAKTGRGIVISDGTSAIYVYGTQADEVKIGDNLKIWARKTTYNGVPELVFDASNESHGIDVISSGNTVTRPDAVDITSNATEYSATEAEFIKLSGTLKVSGSYYNLEIDGVDPTVKQGSLVYPIDELGAAAFDGKKVTVSGYFNGISKGVYINIVATKIVEFVDNPKGTITNPYGADELAALLLAGETFESEVYARGKINKIDSISWDESLGDQYYGNAQYWLSDDGSAATLEVYRGFWFNGDKFTAEDQIKVGDEVLVYGKVKLYVKSDGSVKTPEFDSGNYIVSLNGKTE